MQAPDFFCRFVWASRLWLPLEDILQWVAWVLGFFCWGRCLELSLAAGSGVVVVCRAGIGGKGFQFFRCRPREAVDCCAFLSIFSFLSIFCIVVSVYSDGSVLDRFLFFYKCIFISAGYIVAVLSGGFVWQRT